jgi:hypothetical protein
VFADFYDDPVAAEAWTPYYIIKATGDKSPTENEVE